MSEHCVGVRDPLLAQAGIAHAFGTRASRAPAGCVRPRQVHGTAVALASEDGSLSVEQADVVVSRIPGLPIGVVTADCVPVLVATQSGSAVAAIHAGWRGLAAGVVAAGIAALREQGPDESSLIAAIGPCIGACCYEVDAPVLDALSERIGDAIGGALQPARAGHAMLDLAYLVALDLRRSGVEEMGISRDAVSCTFCDAEHLHSYRRDGPRSGRLLHHVSARSRLEIP